MSKENKRDFSIELTDKQWDLLLWGGLVLVTAFAMAEFAPETTHAFLDNMSKFVSYLIDSTVNVLNFLPEFTQGKIPTIPDLSIDEIMIHASKAGSFKAVTSGVNTHHPILTFFRNFAGGY